MDVMNKVFGARPLGAGRYPVGRDPETPGAALAPPVPARDHARLTLPDRDPRGGRPGAARAQLAQQLNRQEQQARQLRGRLATATPAQAAALKARLDELRYARTQLHAADRALQQLQGLVFGGGPDSPSRKAATAIADQALELGHAPPERARKLRSQIELATARLQGGQQLPTLEAARDALATRAGELGLAIARKTDALAKATPEEAWRIQLELGALQRLRANVDAAESELDGIQRDPKPRTSARARAQHSAIQQAQELVQATPERADSLLVALQDQRRAANGGKLGDQLATGRYALGTRLGELETAQRQLAEQLAKASPSEASQLQARADQLDALLAATHEALASTNLTRLPPGAAGDQLGRELRSLMEQLAAASPEQAPKLLQRLRELRGPRAPHFP